MIERSYSTFSSSRADDQAFLALEDVARLTHDFDDMRVIGGLMVALLTEAFPAPGFVTRRTADVDAAISVQIAHSGALHERLTAAGYVAEGGNRYVCDERVVDVLVPSDTGRFVSAVLGGRGFDSAPGLSLALAAPPILHRLEVVLSDGSARRIEVRTPTVELAVVVKALATRGRHAAKDLVDLYNLLLIVEQYPREELGGWRLDEDEPRGVRRDAVRQLEHLRTMPGLRAALTDTGVPPPAFAQLVRTQLAR
jgi:hypothetical protein